MTIDHQTLEDQTVTIRERDSLKQDRVAMEDVRQIVEKGISFKTLFD